MDYNKQALDLHLQHKGKWTTQSKVTLKDKEDLATYYTPGVGAVSQVIAQDINKSWELTNRGNQVAIVSDGSAVLGLGKIGPEAAVPVMEGKAIIFKEFAGIDAVPLCIKVDQPDQIIEFCKQIAPSFGGINLEDIAAPYCFDILQRLKNELEIPVFHDDQEGTAIVVLAALINASLVVNKNLKELQIIINGAGAAGLAITHLLLDYGIKNITVFDSQGAIGSHRNDLNKYKQLIIGKTNPDQIQGSLKQGIVGADVFIGVSKGKVLDQDMIRSMNNDSIIFAMANPEPEILPDLAYAAGAKIVGTGRSDFKNQINNALIFPGIFKGLLDNRIRKVMPVMKIKVAEAVASSLTPSSDQLLPLVTDKNIVKIIAQSFNK